MTPEERAARERKQKIFIAVGGLFLVAMLAIQLPKLLGGSSSAETAPATDTTTPVQPTVLPGSTTPAAVVDASPTSAASTAKLTSFTVFDPKDPFVQQVVTDSPFGEPAAGGGTKEETPKKKITSKGFTVGSTAAKVTIIALLNGFFPARTSDSPLFARPVSWCS